LRVSLNSLYLSSTVISFIEAHPEIKLIRKRRMKTDIAYFIFLTRLDMKGIKLNLQD
jgi:hypothetical protein